MGSIFSGPEPPPVLPRAEPENLEAQALREARRRRELAQRRRDVSSLIVDPGVNTQTGAGLSITPTQRQ